tara:strand:- start:506 stop:733 length:228 start_codon:yes stop_codon:yes gene_type:complete
MYESVKFIKLTRVEGYGTFIINLHHIVKMKTRYPETGKGTIIWIAALKSHSGYDMIEVEEDLDVIMQYLSVKNIS